MLALVARMMAGFFTQTNCLDAKQGARSHQVRFTLFGETVITLRYGRLYC